MDVRHASLLDHFQRVTDSSEKILCSCLTISSLLLGTSLFVLNLEIRLSLFTLSWAIVSLPGKRAEALLTHTRRLHHDAQDIYTTGFGHTLYRILTTKQQELEVTSIALPPAKAEIVEFDLYRAIAEYDGHLLLSSRTGSGKTTTLQAAIVQTRALHPNAEFWIFDPKGANWVGLEADRSRYTFCNDFRSVPEVLGRFERIRSILRQRQSERREIGGHWQTPPYPIYVLIDEYNTFRMICAEFDDEDKAQRKVDKEHTLLNATIGLKNFTQQVVFQGREDNIHIWLISQTTRVEQLDLDTSVQDNLAYVAQARNNSNDSVEDALSNTYVIGDSAERKAFREMLKSYAEDSSQDKRIPIAFSTVSGKQLIKLPFFNVKTVEKIQQNPRSLQGSPSVHPSPVNPEVNAGGEPWEPLLDGSYSGTGNLSSPYDFPPESGFEEDLPEALLGELIQLHIQEKFTKQQFIEHYWGAKKGKSPAYQSASKLITETQKKQHIIGWGVKQ